MADIQSFFTWFLSQLPTFLLSDPIKYFLGFYFGALAIWLFHRLCNISRVKF